MIKLRTLGECVIEVGGERLAPDSDALFAALLYLCTERGRRVARTTLAELLWPHLVPERGRHCLRQLMYRLRTIGALVEGDRENIILPETLIVATFSAMPTAERLVAERMAGAQVVGPYLPGYAPRHSTAFAEWLDRTRAAAEARVRRVVLEVAHAHKLRGEWDQVDALGREVLRIDPLNEEATLVVAEATAMIGAKSEAIAMLDRYMEDVGPGSSELRLPATVLRRRIAERFPSRRYAGPSERCFVGRADSIELLSTAVLRARNAEGSALLLVGPAGIGKTRLVHELTKLAVMQGVRVVRASMEEVDAERPMAAFVDVVPQLRALPGAIGASPESLAFLDRLTEPLATSASTPLDAADPRWLAARIRQAVVDLVDAVTAEGTVLLLVEDVHWLDAASWATVNALLELVPPRRLVLLLTSRGPHPAAATPERCVERLMVHSVTALTQSASLSLVHAIAADHGGRVTREALQWCVDAAEGNPLFLRELVVHCLEGGASHVVPPSLQGLLDARIAKLRMPSRRVIQAAVVLGDHATIERLDRMLGLPTHELVGALEELSATNHIDPAATNIVPRHGLVATRVLETLPAAAKRWMHQRAAELLSGAEPAAASTEVLLAASAHWEFAGDVGKAVGTLANAAAGVARIGAIQDAIRLLETSLSMHPTEPERTQVLRQIARCFALDAQWSRTAATLRSASSVSGTLSGDQYAADLLLQIEAEFRSGEEPQRLVDRSYDLAADHAISPSWRVAAARRAIAMSARHSCPELQDAIWRVVSDAIAQLQPQDPQRVELEIMREVTVGDMSTAVRRAPILQRAALQVDDTLARLTLLVTASEVYRNAGLTDEMLLANDVVLREARRLGGLHFEMRTLQVAANTLLLERPKDPRAVDFVQRAAELGAEHHYLHSEALKEDLARLAIIGGRYGDAYAYALDLYVLTANARHPADWYIRAARTVLVEVLLFKTSEPIESALIAELLDIHDRCRSLPLHDRTVAVLACALERADRAAEAAAIVDDYIARDRRSIARWRPPREQLGLPPTR